MFYTYVVRPSDGPDGRAPKYHPFWEFCMTYNLRLGFGMQLVAVFGLTVCSLLGGNFAINLGSILSADVPHLEHVPVPLCLFFSAVAAAGALKLQGYRQLADDDASIKHGRGFRAGTKCIYQASLFDAISWVMTGVLFYATFHFFEEEWAEKQAGSGSMDIFILVTRSCHALSLFFYGGSIFMLEMYHPVGTVEFWSWTNVILFKFAGLFEIGFISSTSSAARSAFDAAFTLTFFAALTCAFLWSITFEPVANEMDVSMSQSALRNEYFKSQNAMAYYGPPVIQGIEMPEGT